VSAHNTDRNSRQAVAAGERRPETFGAADVRNDGESSSGLRLRFAAERGSGASGTSYNRFDWEVLDHEAPAGRRIVCRANHSNAQRIAAALNEPPRARLLQRD